MEYEIEHYCSDSGRDLIEEFLESLDDRTLRNYYRVKDWLKENGPKLPWPHAKKINNDIYELRFNGIEGVVRVMYFFIHNHKIILTNGFVKKTGKTPKNEMEIAIQRRKLSLNL